MLTRNSFLRFGDFFNSAYFLTKKSKREKNGFVAARLTTIAATHWSGNRFFLGWPCMQPCRVVDNSYKTLERPLIADCLTGLILVILDHVERPALVCGEALIHFEDILCEEFGLVPAHTGRHLQNHVSVVRTLRGRHEG